MAVHRTTSVQWVSQDMQDQVDQTSSCLCGKLTMKCPKKCPYFVDRGENWCAFQEDTGKPVDRFEAGPCKQMCPLREVRILREMIDEMLFDEVPG